MSTKTNHFILERSLSGSRSGLNLMLAPCCLGLLLPCGTQPVMAEDLHLVGGDVLTVEVLERLDDRLIVEHEVLGRLEIALDRIESMAIGEQASNLGAMQDDPPADAPEKEWKSKFTLGFTGSAGNTETVSLNVGITSIRERETDTIKLDTSYYLGQTGGDKTDSRFTAGLRKDWFIVESPWLYFAQGRYDYDEFQSWDHRLSGHVGMGYKWIDEEDFKAKLRFGLGASKEWGSDEQNIRPEGLLGISLDWTISEKQTLGFESTYYPDLEELSDFRLVTTADWSLRMDDEMNMSLTVGLRHEYQSEVDPGVDKHDLKVFAGLQFDF